MFIDTFLETLLTARPAVCTFSIPLIKAIIEDVQIFSTFKVFKAILLWALLNRRVSWSNVNVKVQ